MTVCVCVAVKATGYKSLLYAFIFILTYVHCLCQRYNKDQTQLARCE